MSDRLEEMRHAVARIIDPNCWWDDVPPNDHQQRKCNRALAKADEIITRLAAKPADEGVRERADLLITTKFDEVSCKQLANCGWPECECPRSAKHSTEAISYAFTKARELLVAAGFAETAAILHDCRPALSPTEAPKP